jgi:hypothetical protein
MHYRRASIPLSPLQGKFVMKVLFYPFTTTAATIIPILDIDN